MKYWKKYALIRRSNFDPQFITNQIFYDIDPTIINFGRCFLWAYSAHLLFRHTTLCSVESHAFIRYKGKYYDSDHPQGVKSWHLLPATSFSKCLEYSSYPVDLFKREWARQLVALNTSWEEIEKRAQRALIKLYEKS